MQHQRMRKANRSHDSFSSMSRSRTRPPLPRSSIKVEPRKLSFEEVMELNGTAMEALREGEMERSHRCLSMALGGSEFAIAALERLPQRSRDDENQFQAWVLAYSDTLSNLGCQLRRDGQVGEALTCLREAKEVETWMLGKPSCSTMLNLSAVLLGVGSAEEALPIAKDCVAASQKGDRVLFITALHNLAVALGQVEDDRERRAALPTMLRALRESQQHLGEGHPTTKSLQEKCHNSQTWILPKRSGSSSSPAAGRRAKSISQRSGSMAGSSLLPNVKGSRPSSSRSPSKRRSTVRSASPREGGSRRRTVSGEGGAAKPGNGRLAPMRVGTGTKPISSVSPLQLRAKKALQSLDFGYLTDVLEIEDGTLTPGMDASSPADGAAAASCPSTERTHVDQHGAIAGGCLGSDELCDGVVKSYSSPIPTSKGDFAGDVLDEPLVELEDGVLSPARDGEKDGEEPSSAKEPALTEEEAAAAALREEEEQLAARRRHNLYDTDGAQIIRVGRDHTSYLRFAAVEDMDCAAPPALLTYRQIRNHLRRTDDATVKLTARRDDHRHCSPRSDIPDPFMGTNQFTTDLDPSSVNRSTFHELHQAKQRQRDVALHEQQKEEQRFRLKKLQEEEEKRKLSAFQAALNAITDRTEARAAVKIQETWTRWWREIGRPRRALQKKREEERRRRLQRRLEMVDQQKPAQKDPSAKSEWNLAGRAPPSVVVRCGRRWLAKTAGVRFLAANAYSLEGLNEALVQKAVVMIQQRWRGVAARMRVVRIREAADVLRQMMRPGELADYSALLIQKCARRMFARKRLQEKSLERYTGPAITIQRWFRARMESQRARGVDTTSIVRRLNAAIIIQRNWRGYQGRIRFYMAKLRTTIEHDREHERKCARLVQRVARGYVGRRRLAKTMVKSIYEAARAELRAEEEAKERERLEAEALRSKPIAAIPRTEYERECLRRAPALARLRDEDREKYDVPLYYEPQAEIERRAWKEYIRIRPHDVLLRREQENLHCAVELNSLRRIRAAKKIQREFRAWLRFKRNPNRDASLLTISRAKYQVREYERQIQQKQHAREQERGRMTFGDQTAPMRQEREAVHGEMVVLRDQQPDHFPLDQLRSRAERLDAELALRKDEIILKRTYPAEMVRLREDPEAVKAATGAVYKHPYFHLGYPHDNINPRVDLD